MCGRYAVGNCISNYKKSFQHYVEYYEGCTIEEADETDEDEEIENQTENDTEENVELEMIDMQSLLAIRIFFFTCRRRTFKSQKRGKSAAY